MWAGCAALASALLAAIGYTWCCVAAKRLDVRGAAYVAQARRIASHVRWVCAGSVRQLLIQVKNLPITLQVYI